MASLTFQSRTAAETYDSILSSRPTIARGLTKQSLLVHITLAHSGLPDSTLGVCPQNGHGNGVSI